MDKDKDKQCSPDITEDSLVDRLQRSPPGRYELAEFLCEKLALESFDSISREKYLGDAKAILEFLSIDVAQSPPVSSEQMAVEMELFFGLTHFMHDQ